jgi:hypothetical protein
MSNVRQLLTGKAKSREDLAKMFDRLAQLVREESVHEFAGVYVDEESPVLLFGSADGHEDFFRVSGLLDYAQSITRMASMSGFSDDSED